jgi:hypothetical protein
MHPLDSELGALEVKFGPLPMQTWLDVKFDSTQFQKKLPNFEFGLQSCGRFTEPPPS